MHESLIPRAVWAWDIISFVAKGVACNDNKLVLTHKDMADTIDTRPDGSYISIVFNISVAIFPS